MRSASFHLIAWSMGRKGQYPRLTSPQPCGSFRSRYCDAALSLKGRPELEKAIDQLGTGDVLMVAEWDRATQSMMDGIRITFPQEAHVAAARTFP
jgi:DNA invertase Pin-like site-specific DNA recombinase